MDERELIHELAQKAVVSPTEARAVLGALAEIHRGAAKGRVGATAPPVFASYVPSPREVERLIDEAGTHPLGLDFLRAGELGAVAAVFGTHAFTVEAARGRLTGRGQ